jgi:capsular polysaccharide biosynthesis protein
VKTDRSSLPIDRMGVTRERIEVLRPEAPETWWERLARPLMASLCVAVVAGLMGASVASTISLTRPPTYRSQATLLIDEPQAVGTSQDQGVLIKLSTLRAKYAALAGTSAIAGPAGQLSGVPESTVTSDGSVVVGVNDLTMQSQGLSSDPTTAHAVAQGMADSLSQFVAQEQANLNIPPEDKVVVSVIQAASAPGKIAPTLRQGVSIALVAALTAAILAYVVAQLAFTRARAI